MVAARVCRHCERRSAVSKAGLCRACHRVKGIRVLYIRRRGRTPEWEEHLRRLAQRARARLPLFDEPGNEPTGRTESCEPCECGRRAGRPTDD
jgi:hypothetical protein